MDNQMVSDDYYLKLVLDTNVNLLSQIDETWLNHLPHGALCLKLVTDVDAREKLQEYLQNYYAWMGEYEFDALCWPGQLAMLPSQDLKQLLLYLAVWYFSQEIRHLVTAEQVAGIRDAIGENAYDFAIKQAPYIYRNEYRKEHSNSTAPKPDEKLTLTQLMITEHCGQSDNIGNTIKDNLSRVGLMLIARELSLLPQALSMRLFSKLPYSWYLERQQLQSGPLMMLDDNADPLLIKRILVECLPQCSNMLQ